MVHQDERPANGFVCGSFFAIGKCFRPDRRTAGVPKAGRTVGGPAMQAPASKGQSFHKNIPLFCDSIVGASNAWLAKPCDPARLFGWSRAPPLRWAVRELAKLQALFRDFAVGAGLALPVFFFPASLRICRRSFSGKGHSGEKSCNPAGMMLQ